VCEFVVADAEVLRLESLVDPAFREERDWCARRAFGLPSAPAPAPQVTIALVAGTILTAINQADVIARGDATSTTLAKAALNYLVPFIVSNLGLLAGRDSGRER
jgi:hypothetical protein